MVAVAPSITTLPIKSSNPQKEKSSFSQSSFFQEMEENLPQRPPSRLNLLLASIGSHVHSEISEGIKFVLICAQNEMTPGAG